MSGELRDMANGSRPLTINTGNSSGQAIEAEPLCYPTVALGLPGFLAPKSVSDVKELAKMIALAEWAPECYRDIDGNFLQQKIELAIMHGASVGLGPIAAVQAIALINGTPSIWGDGALSVIEHSGLLEDMVEDYQVDDEQGLVATCTMKRRGRATPIVTRFSLAMAEHAGLTRNEGPWQTYPERMLRMRARSWTMRDGFADVLRGLHLREEVEDYVSPRGERPRRSPPAEPSPLGSSRQYPSPRPRRGAEFVAARRPDDGSIANASVGSNQGRFVAEPALNETYTLVDADGAFIEVAGSEALRDRFEEICCDKHLSPDQVAGVWESNEPARKAIERLFGPGALGPAEAHLSSSQAMRTPPSDGQRPQSEKSSLGSPPVNGQDPLEEPDQALVLEINPTWGDQKVFQTYRAALTKLANDGARHRPKIRDFRQANHAIETRLRTKLGDRMTQIDKICEFAATEAGSDAAA
jgi:hypothetical protein